MKKYVLFTSLLILLVVLCGCASKSDMTDNLYEFTFKFDSETYTLPENISTFTDNGWSFPDDFKDFDYTLTYGNLKSTYLSKGDDWFNIEIFNYEKQDKAVKDCPIGRITYDFSGDIKVTTAGGYELNGKTLDDIKDKYGDPFSEKKYGNYIEVIYDKNPGKSTYDRYTFRFDLSDKTIEYIDIYYFN